MNSNVKGRIETAIDILIEALDDGDDDPPEPPKPPLGLAKIINFPTKPPLYHPGENVDFRRAKAGNEIK
jgi:hypothetical protein